MASPAELSVALKASGRRLGFDLVGIVDAKTPTGLARFDEWLQRGFAGEMQYLERRYDAYTHPQGVLSGVRSLVMVALNYNSLNGKTDAARTPALHDKDGIPARVATYAQGATDYHDLLRTRLRLLADELHAMQPGCRTRGVVDTAPILERDFARQAGLGWFGKNTMLINKRLGSWFFLAGLLTDVELEPDPPHATSHCGTCTRCLEVCPTQAFPEPGVLDARRCISYLTIELKGNIPIELRDGMGDWMFGCDLCQEVCPWNRKAPVSSEPQLAPLPDLQAVDALTILGATDAELRERFANSALSRPGPVGLKRNAAIVAGNSGNQKAVPVLVTSLAHGDPIVRVACAWALGKLGGSIAIQALKERRTIEDNPEVCTALDAALSDGADQPTRSTCK